MATKTQVRCHIRWMIRRDMDEVMEISSACKGEEWTDEDFFRNLRRRATIGMVAEVGERVVGFMVYTLKPDRIHIEHFGVNQDCRRYGVGSQMIDKLISKLSPSKRWILTANVPEICTEMQIFLREKWFWCHESTGDTYRFRYEMPGDDRM